MQCQSLSPWLINVPVSNSSTPSNFLRLGGFTGFGEWTLFKKKEISNRAWSSYDSKVHIDISVKKKMKIHLNYRETYLYLFICFCLFVNWKRRWYIFARMINKYNTHKQTEKIVFTYICRHAPKRHIKTLTWIHWHLPVRMRGQTGSEKQRDGSET